MKVLLATLFCCLLTGCQIFSGARRPSEDYEASIELLEAEATLHRAAEEFQNEEKELFILRTSCVLKVSNNSGRTQMVVSEFGSPYDDLRLRIRDEHGKRISTTAHALLMEPTLKPEWHPLDKGDTYVQLTTATFVGDEPRFPELPFIKDKELTQTIQMEYFGGFPGSDLRAVQSNRMTVKIQDRTAEEPQKPTVTPAERV